MSLPVVFRDHSTYLMFISVCLIYLNLFAIVYLHPFSNEHNNHVSALGWITTVIFLFAGVIIGFLSVGSADDNGPIHFTVISLFYITMVVMIHASFYEWILFNGAQWRRSSRFMAKLMETRVWKRVFPPRGNETKHATKNKKLKKEDGPGSNETAKLTSSQATLSIKTNTLDKPAASLTAKEDDDNNNFYEVESAERRLLPTSATSATKGTGVSLAIGLGAIKNFITNPWTSTYMRGNGSPATPNSKVDEEEADISQESLTNVDNPENTNDGVRHFSTDDNSPV
ncbi:hypothetical protein HDU97_002511 [Phlyctochytrium planicorne]|nr:hypothetical protein HDU97_002511 [Phlyctochytrium planicorne]